MVCWPRTVSIALLLGCNAMITVFSMTPADDSKKVYSSTATAEDEDDWWRDAEEVDLTIPFELHLVLPPSGRDNDGVPSYPEGEGSLDSTITEDYDDFFTSNESCFWEIDCEEFSKLDRPPDFLGTMPPPPVPPFLRELQEVMEKDILYGRDTEEEMTFFELKEKEQIRERQKCFLCDWAEAGNESLNYWTRKKEIGMDFGAATVPALIGVALLSAVVGAALMGMILLRCKKFNIADRDGDKHCLFWKRCFKYSSSSVEVSEINSNKIAKDTKKTSNRHRVEWPTFRLWRKCSSEPSIKVYSPTSYENSLSDKSNAVGIYALNPANVGATSKGLTIHPTHSDVANSVSPSELNSCNSHFCSDDGTYENAAYVLSETANSDPNELSSSAGSVSTPSSAYYSDLSMNDLQSNKKNKRKCETEYLRKFKMTQPVFPFNLKSISNTAVNNQIPLRPVCLNPNMKTASGIQHCCHHFHTDATATQTPAASRQHPVTITDSFLETIPSRPNYGHNFNLKPSNLSLNNLKNCDVIDRSPFTYALTVPNDVSYDNKFMFLKNDRNDAQSSLSATRQPCCSQRYFGVHDRDVNSVYFPDEFI